MRTNTAPSTHLVLRLMVFEASTLAIASALHLSGADSAMTFRGATAAGIAEALICLALLFGAGALASGRRWANSAALGAVAFAIFGFVLGLTITVGSGDVLDVAYHATMLPILILTSLLLTRTRPFYRGV